MFRLQGDGFHQRMALVFLLLSVSGAGVLYLRTIEKTPLLLGKQAVPEIAAADASLLTGIQIEVTGAVANPGIYTLTGAATVGSAVAAAGGFLPEADTERLSLLDSVFDLQALYVPVLKEEAVCVGYSDTLVAVRLLSEAPKTLPEEKININTADKALLQRLPGVGERIAQNIIEYRKTHGAFVSLEELKNVPKIGDKIYEGLKEYITLEKAGGETGG